MSSFHSDNIYDDLDMSDETDCNIEITTSSFCNNRQTKYVTPLERNHLKCLLPSSEENINPALSKVTEGRKSTKLIKQSKTARTKNGVKAITKKRTSTNIYKSPVAVVNKPYVANEEVDEVSEEKYKNNKFFKSRPSEVRRESVSWKSFSLYDTKTFNNLYKKKINGLKDVNKRKVLKSVGNKQVSVIKNTSCHNIGSKTDCDTMDLSFSEGYASLPDENSCSTTVSDITTVSDVSHLSENGEKESQQLVKSGAQLPKTRPVNIKTRVPDVKKNGLVNGISKQPTSVQDIFKDLTEAFSQIEPSAPDCSCSDYTFDDEILNGNILPAEIKQNSQDQKQLYSIFYRKEKGHNTSKRGTQEKRKSKAARKLSFVGESNQMMIDAGQKEFGARECSSCGMVYEVGSEVDKTLHEKYHEMFIVNLNFPGWKKERVVGNYHDGHIVMITKDDPNFKLRKVEDVLKIVDRDLGTSNGFPQRPNVTILLFISNKMIVGCLVAESISCARRLVLDTSTDVTTCEPEEEGKTTEKWCQSKKLVKALCGVNRIWVAREYRRQKIASRLLNCLRCNFIYGYTVSTSEIAFLDPSANGRDFAAAYTKTNNFLVYK